MRQLARFSPMPVVESTTSSDPKRAVLAPPEEGPYARELIMRSTGRDSILEAAKNYMSPYFHYEPYLRIFSPS